MMACKDKWKQRCKSVSLALNNCVGWQYTNSPDLPDHLVSITHYFESTDGSAFWPDYKVHPDALLHGLPDESDVEISFYKDEPMPFRASLTVRRTTLKGAVERYSTYIHSGKTLGDCLVKCVEEHIKSGHIKGSYGN
jgi:hypothetical protein